MAEEVATAYISLMPSFKGAQAAIEKELQGSLQAPLQKEAQKAGSAAASTLATTMQRELSGPATSSLQRAVAQQSQAASTGILSTIRTAVQAYGGGKAVLAGLATQASSATQQLSGMVRGSGELSTSTGALKAGLLGVSGLLGGPWGLAIAGGSLALNGFMEAQQRADDATKAFLDTLDKQTGKVTAESAQTSALAFLNSLSGADVSKLQALGFSVQSATQAVLAGGTAFDTYRAKLEGVGAEYVKTHPLTDETAQSIRHMLDQLDAQNTELGNSQTQWSKNTAAQKIATAIAAQLAGQTNALADAVNAASGQYQIQITTNMAEVINQAKKMLLLLAQLPGGSGKYSAGAALSSYINSIESGAVVDPITTAANAAKKKSSGGGRRASRGGGSSGRSSSGSSARSALLDLIGGSFASDLAGSDRAGIARATNALSAAARKALSGSTETAVTKLIAKDTIKLQALAAKRALIGKRLEAAQNNLANLTQAKASTVASLTQAGMGDLVGARSSSGVIRVLAKQLEKVKGFRSNLAILARRGLPKAFLQQLVNAGLDGAMTAAALARSSDSDFASITALTNQLSTQASGLGNDAGSLLYDSGIAAAKGLIAGLKHEQPAIEATMLAIAKGMEKAIKQALGIHSPSRVFRDLGRQIPLGMAAGIDDKTPDVHRRLARMAPTGNGYRPTGPAAAGGRQIHVENHMYGMDPQAAAVAVSNELVWRNRR